MRHENKISSDNYEKPPEGYDPRADFQQVIIVLGKLKERAKKKYPLNFWKVDLREIYFEPQPNADFSDANFTNAWIGGCDFRGTRLAGARFVKVKFGKRTDFSDADLSEADFRGADLSKVSGLRKAELENAKYWDDGEFETTFPAEFNAGDINNLKMVMVKADPEVDDPYRPE